MASDTCITLGGNVEPYGGIKILAVPVRILGPTDANTGNAVKLYEHVAGLAFAGSVTTAFHVKEVICEVLSHLQSLLPPERQSFEQIASLAFRFYKHLFSRFQASLQWDMEADFILAGYCPTARTIRAFRFWSDDQGAPYFTEVLQQHRFSYDAIGSGSNRFRQFFEQDLQQGNVRVHFQIPSRIRDVINDQDVPSVGGTIQLGEFNMETGDFELFGVVETDANAQTGRRVFIRGTDLDEAHQQSDPLGLHVSYSFKDLRIR